MLEENAIDAGRRRFNPPQLPADILSVRRASPKAENLLITKGKVSGFSLPKAENMLKTSQLPNCKMIDWAPQNVPAGRRIDLGRWA
jgi:hypothetical protein